MKIKIIEKAVLTEEETKALDKACDIIDQLYKMASSNSKLEKQLSDLLTALSDFIDEVEVVIDNN